MSGERSEYADFEKITARLTIPRILCIVNAGWTHAWSNNGKLDVCISRGL